MQTSNSRTKHPGGDPINKNSFLTPWHWSKLPDMQIPKLLQFVVCFRTNIWMQNKLSEVTYLWLEQASRSNRSNSWTGQAGLRNAFITHPKLPIFVSHCISKFLSRKKDGALCAGPYPRCTKIAVAWALMLWPLSQQSRDARELPQGGERQFWSHQPLLNCSWSSAREQEFWAWNWIQQAWEN